MLFMPLMPPCGSSTLFCWLRKVSYLTYLALLALFGLPNMEYLLVFGKHSSTFWMDWGVVFNKLILFSFLKWAVVGILVGGFAGWVTSSVYSVWFRKTRTLNPA